MEKQNQDYVVEALRNQGVPDSEIQTRLMKAKISTSGAYDPLTDSYKDKSEYEPLVPSNVPQMVADEAQPISDIAAVPSNLPPLFDGSETDKDLDFLRSENWQALDNSDLYLSGDEPYQEPRFVYSRNGIKFAPLTDIHALTGVAGSGKTWTFVQLMAAALSGECGGIKYELSDDIPEPVILYVDTEQAHDQTVLTMHRVLSLIGWPIGQKHPRFKVLALREVAEAQERWRRVLKALYEVRPTICYLDGALDLVSDFNDNELCSQLVYKCMQCASHYDISIWCLAHENPFGGKMTGHLGSVLLRKVSDVFGCEKVVDEKHKTISFEVTQKKARSRDVPSWKFRVLPVGSYGQPEEISETEVSPSEVEHISKMLADGQFDIKWPATLKQIKGIFKSLGGVTSSDVLQAYIQVARNRRFIIPQEQSEMDRGQKYPLFYLHDDLVRPF